MKFVNLLKEAAMHPLHDRLSKDMKEKPDNICVMYCENYMECCGIRTKKENCGTYMVLEDRYSKEEDRDE